MLGDETMEANYLSGVGDYYKSVGDYENALKFKEAAGELYRRNNLLIDEARLVLAIVGNIKGSMGEFDTMNYKGEAEVLNDIGLAYQDDGDYSKALEYTQTALRTAQRYNEQWTEMWAYHSLGNIYLELGEADNALK